MFKKHISTGPDTSLLNGHHSSPVLTGPLITRNQTLKTTFIDEPSSENPTAISTLKKHNFCLEQLQKTNTRKVALEKPLQALFRYGFNSFSKFVNHNKGTLFCERLQKLTDKSVLHTDYDSDHETNESEQIPSRDVMRVLRLYLRLSIRIKELQEITRDTSPQSKNTVSIIGYPRSSEENPRSVIENNYSEVEAYVFKTSENLEKLVLSKSSWIYQKQVYGDLFKTTDTKKFLDAFKTVFQEIDNPNLSTKFNPYHYNDILFRSDGDVQKTASRDGFVDTLVSISLNFKG